MKQTNKSTNQFDLIYHNVMLMGIIPLFTELFTEKMKAEEDDDPVGFLAMLSA